MANTLNLGTNGNWATKKDSLLAYNSENGNFKPLPFSFDRASSATRVNKDGLIETVGSGEPRIDYKDDSNGALLLEPSRTNYDSESLNFTTSFMSNSSGIQSSSLTSKIAPDGSNDSVYKITKATDNSDPYLGRSGVSFTDTKMVFSAWLWTDENQSKDVLFLVYRDGAQEVQTKNITLTTTPTRYFIEATFTTTPSNVAYRIDLDGVSSNQYIYAWGKQVEAGSYATSYIPTQGSIGTRNRESCEQTPPSSIIGQTEGTLYAELGNIPNNAIDDVFIELSDGTSNNRILFYADANGHIRNQIKSNGSISSLINTNVDVSSNMKIAITYKTNEAKVFINGVQYGGTDTSVVVPSVSKINLENYTGTRSQSSSLKETKLYDTALTDQELINLTTI